jgi:hypothetical protein
MHLAQINVARLRAPLDSPQLAGFVALLEPINALADSSPGFVWRYITEGADDATAARPFPDEMMLLNFSVWESREALWNFVYRSAHLDALRQRREWFSKLAESYQALWWVRAGHRPSVAEAVHRLELLRRQGPGPEAFTFADFVEFHCRPGTAHVADATAKQTLT